MDKNLRKNFAWNIIGVSINSFNSLLYLMVINRINSKFDAGIFTFAFSLMSLFYIMAIYYTRVFQISNGEDNNKYISCRLATCLLTIIIVFLLCIANSYDFYKLIVIMLLCVYRILEAMADVFYGILHRHDELFKSGISLTIKGILSIVSFTIIDIVTNNLIYSILGIIISNLFVFILFDLLSSRKYLKNFKFSFNFYDVLKESFPIFIIAFASIYMVNVSKYILDFYDTAEVQNIFGIILMPATFMSLCAQYIMNPFLNVLDELKNNKKNFEFIRLSKKITISLLFVGVLVLVVSYFIGIRVLNILYSIDLCAYNIDLMMIIVGSTLFALANAYSSVLVILKKNYLQMFIYLFVSVTSTIVGVILVSIYHLRGASISYLISMMLLYVLYYIVYKYYLKEFFYER